MMTTNTKHYPAAAAVAFSGTATWKAIWAKATITTHEVAGITSLVESTSDDGLSYSATLTGWLHDDDQFTITALTTYGENGEWIVNVDYQTKPACPECGSPAGECYRICPNSEHYYSPEQERADAEAFEASGGYAAQRMAEMREDAHLEAMAEGFWEDEG